MAGTLPFESEYTRGTHFFGFAHCETLGRCDRDRHQLVGSSCGARRGYCYTSSAHTLECGRTIVTTDRFGGNLVRHRQPRRCPRGTPSVNGGATGTVVTARRLVIAGCMRASDALYSPSAEVHVPHMCAQPAHYRRGCLFPGALNYAPNAAESADCLYSTRGCTEPSALNYNSRATVDDGSCIGRVGGCTLPVDAYDGVPHSAPGYQSLWVGVPRRGVGRVPHPTYGGVLAHDPSANVLAGCTIVIEGCMDPQAANYDPAATANSGTWCVPRILGCMMPSSASGGGRAAVGRDFGGAANFAPGATVHAARACLRERRGCMDSAALNYDAHATVDAERCYHAREGCLLPAALNFRCAEHAGQLTPCPNLEPPVTVHRPFLCNLSPPPDDPIAALPPLADGVYAPVEVRYELLLRGDVASLPPGSLGAAQRQVAARARVDEALVEVSAHAASVMLRVVVTSADARAAASVVEALADPLASAAAANALLNGTGLPTVHSAPRLSVAYADRAPAPPPAPDHAAIALRLLGISAASLVLLSVLVALGLYKYELLIFLHRQRSSTAKYSAQVVPEWTADGAESATLGR